MTFLVSAFSYLNEVCDSSKLTIRRWAAYVTKFLFRFAEIEELGSQISKAHPEVKPLLKEMEEIKRTVHELWHEKHAWICQNLDLQIFNREANYLHNLCTSQIGLLESADLGVI